MADNIVHIDLSKQKEAERKPKAGDVYAVDSVLGKQYRLIIARGSGFGVVEMGTMLMQNMEPKSMNDIISYIGLSNYEYVCTLKLLS